MSSSKEREPPSLVLMEEAPVTPPRILLTLAEASERTGRSERALKSFIEIGALRARFTKSGWRVQEEDVSKFLATISRLSKLVVEEPKGPGDRSKGFIQALRDGDRWAWEKLFKEYYPRLLGSSRNRGFSIEDAEEIADDALVKVFQKINTYDPTLPFDNWIFTLNRHAAIDWRKALANRYETEQGITFDCFEMVSEKHPDDDDLEGVRRARRERIRRHIDTLNPRHQEVIRLRDFVGLSSREAAENLFGRLGKRSENAADALHHRAVRSLAKSVWADSFFEENPIPQKEARRFLPFSREEIRQGFFLDMGRWRQTARSVEMPSLEAYDALEYIILVRPSVEDMTKEELEAGKGAVDFDPESRKYDILSPAIEDLEVMLKPNIETLDDLVGKFRVTVRLLQDLDDGYWHRVFSEKARCLLLSYYVAREGRLAKLGSAYAREFHGTRKTGYTWDSLRRGSLGGESLYLYDYADMSPPDGLNGRNRTAFVLPVPSSPYDEFDPKRDFNLPWEGFRGMFPPRLCQAIVLGRRGARRFCSDKNSGRLEAWREEIARIRAATKPLGKRRDSRPGYAPREGGQNSQNFLLSDRQILASGLVYYYGGEIERPPLLISTSTNPRSNSCHDGRVRTGEVGGIVQTNPNDRNVFSHLIVFVHLRLLLIASILSTWGSVRRLTMNVESIQNDLRVVCAESAVPMPGEAVALAIALLARWALRAAERPGRRGEVEETRH